MEDFREMAYLHYLTASLRFGYLFSALACCARKCKEYLSLPLDIIHHHRILITIAHIDSTTYNTIG